MGKEYKSASQLMREAEERRASAAMTAGAAQKSAEELEIEQARAETESIKKNINIFQTAIGTLIDTGFNIDKGTLKGLEGIVDFVIGLRTAVPVGINYLCGGDWDEKIKQIIEYDATGKIMGLREDLTGMIYGRTTLDSSLYRQNKAGQMVAEVEQAVGQMLPSVAVSIATAGAAAPETAASLGTTVQGLAQAASLATLGVSAAGTSTEAAYQDGANFGQGLAYGAVSGGIEVATEKMFGGVTSAIYGKGMLPHVVPTIANKGFVRVGRELLEEGVEEVVSELASPIAKTIYKGGAALDEYSTADYWKGVGKSFAMGAATSALYTGTVGYGVAKATGGAVGKEADIEGLLEDAEKLAQKRESVFYSYKYDRNTDARIGDQIARRYQEISKILVKMDPAKRSAAIEKFSLGKAMAEDGQIAADFADKLGIRTQEQNSTGGVNAAPGGNLGQYASPGVDASAAEAAASDMGLSVFHGELTGESRTNFRDFLKTARNLNRQTGGRFNFVLVNSSGVDGSQVKGAYVRQGDLVLINTDTLADSGKTADALYENWFGVTVEEAMHLANNTDEALRRDAYSSLAQLLSEDEELVSKVSRELVEDGYFTEEQVKKFMTADSLTEDETQAANVFFDELFAHMARHELSTKHFFQRLARRDRSAMERFLHALKQTMKATASGKGKAAQGLTKRAQAAERLFMEAMAEAGFKATEDGKIIGVNDEEEEEIRYSLRKEFTGEFDEWMESKTPTQRAADGGYFKIGRTSSALGKIGVRDANIYWRKSKIQMIMEEHPNITEKIIKDIPSIVEKPVLVMKSKTRDDSIVIFGDIRVKDSIVMLALDLTPKQTGVLEAQFNLITSAYDRTNENAANLITSSDILYVAEKNRVDTLLMPLRVQFPSGQQAYDSATGSISYNGENVNINGKKIFVRMQKNGNGAKSTGETISEKQDIRQSKKAAKRDEVTLTPEEAAREDTPFGHATRRMLERDGETGESRVETDAETAGETPDEIGEYVRLNRYGQLWVYGHEEAQKAFDKAMNVLQSAINEETWKTEGEVAKVQFLRSDERKTVDELWLAMNNAQTETQRRQAAVELAQVLYKRARVEVVVDDENFHRAEDVVNYLKQYLHRMDLDSIKSEIQYREDGAAADILRLWSGKKGGSERFTPDQISEEFTSQTGIVIESDHPADIMMELHERYLEARKELERQGKFALSEKFAAEDTDIKNIADVLMEIMETGGEITSPAELLDEVSEQKRRLESREKWTEKRLDEKEAYLQKKIKAVKEDAKENIQKAVDKNREQLAANYYASRAAYIAGGIRSWKSGEFQAAAEKSNSDILKGTLGKLSKIYYRGNLAVDPTKRVMRELHDWYITQEAKDFLGESFWNQDIAEDMESIASVKGSIDSENLKKLCDVLQYMKHAIENFHTVFVNGKRVAAEPVAREYHKKAVEGGREIKKQTWFGRIFRAYIVNYRDPESLARYFDNYVEGGFLTETLQKLREGELKAEVIEDSMVSQIEEFSKKHKKYFDKLKQRTIQVENAEIPAAKALYLRLLLMDEDARRHLMRSGYGYADGIRTIRKSGFLEEITVKPPDELELDDFEREKHRKRAQQLMAMIDEQTTADDKAFMQLAAKLFNDDCKNYKKKTDLRRMGWSNVKEDFYICMRAMDKEIRADDGKYQDELDRVSNSSFNKNRVTWAENKLLLEDLLDVLTRHIRGVSKYAGLSEAIDNYEMLVNFNLNPNSHGDIISIKTSYENVWPNEGKTNPGAVGYLKEMISDVQKLSRDAGNTDPMTAMVEKVRGRAAEAVLGLNPKILATQFSSLFAATSIIPPKYIIQALYTRAKHGEAGDYSDLARLRNKENVAIRAMTLDDRVGAIAEKCMFLIGKTDEFVVHTVWKACKLMVRDQVGASVSQEAVNTQAGQLLTQVIYETQQNAQSTERSRAMRSNSPIAKIVTMFSADAMKVFGRVMDGVGELRARMARHESPARIAESKRKLGRSVSAMVSSAVYYAIISMLFRKFLARDDDDNLKEWSEADILEFLGDMAGSMMGGLPIIKEIYEFLMSGFSPEDMGLGALTDMMEGVKSLGLVVGQGFTGQATDEEWFSAIRKLMYAGGTVCGIPIANTIKYTRGLVNLFSDDTVYRYDALHAIPAYSSDIAKAVENGDEEMVRTVVGVMLDKNVGAVTSSPVRRELARLASAGQTVIPQAVGTSITYDGEAYQMNQRERKAFSSVYGQASAEAAQMISMASYQAMDDKVKAKALKRLYQFYYNMAMEEVLGVDIEGRAQLVSKVIDPLKLALIVAEAGELAADIGSDGKTIAGSKKMKVAQYIAKLKLTEAQKFIVYAYLGYTVSGGEQTIRAYVMAQKNLERGEKEEILEMCGGGY
ncbi:MAG: hypothetical protein ACI4PL_04515 [Faecousia sp.]